MDILKKYPIGFVNLLLIVDLIAMNDSIVEELKGEIDDFYSNDDLFNITSWGADISVREISMSYNDGDLVKPELQRKYVWDKKESSRFIESILLGLPVPSIFLANDEEGRKLIVDGYQRIKTICDFMNGIWSGDGTPFILTDSDRINDRWRNKGFNDLCQEDKRRFKFYTIHAIIFEQKHPKKDNGMYQIFERINTSGRSLNAQEIRNCVYQGKLNSLLFELNSYKKWRLLFGQDEQDSRMLDLELILRFFTLSQNDILTSSKATISLKKALNDYMCNNCNPTDDFLKNKRDEFCSCIDFITTHIGDDAFYNLSNDLVKIRKKFYPTIFDSIMIATKIALSNGYDKPEKLSFKRIELLKDSSYRDSITQGTMKVESIKNRVDKALNYLFNMGLKNE